MNSPEDVYKEVVCGAAVNKNRELLLVRSEGLWITPGGKKEIGESYEEALKREFKEELQGADVQIKEKYLEIEEMTPNSEEKRTFHIYLVDTEKPIKGVSAEIEDYSWTRYPEMYKTSMVTDKTIEKLREDSIINEQAYQKFFLEKI